MAVPYTVNVSLDTVFRPISVDSLGVNHRPGNTAVELRHAAFQGSAPSCDFHGIYPRLSPEVSWDWLQVPRDR